MLFIVILPQDSMAKQKQYIHVLLLYIYLLFNIFFFIFIQ